MTDPINLPIINGDLDVIKNLVESNTIHVNQRLISFHETILHFAARKRWLDIVEYLVEHGADIDELDNNAHTPLFDAAHHGAVHVVQYLISKGANICAKARNGYTPLHAAVNSNHIETVKCLVEQGADINALSNNNHTPLRHAVGSRAAGKGNYDIVKYLLDCGADKEIPDENGLKASKAAWKAGYGGLATYIESYVGMPTKGVHD
jgi:ankyrin repeat protein